MTRSSSWRSIVWSFGVIASCTSVMTSVMTACSEPHAVEPDRPDPATLLYRVVFDYHSVLLAVDDTVQLHMVAYSLGGDTIQIPATSIAWKTNNDAVTVDSLGRMVGRAQSFNSIQVSGSWTLNDVERADTMEVSVVDTAYPVAYIKVTPLDSSRTGYDATTGGAFVSYNIQGLSADSQPVLNIDWSINVKERTGGSVQVALFPFGFDGLQVVYAPLFVGETWIKTKTLVFGVLYQDSVKYTGLYPALITVGITQIQETGAFLQQQRYNFLQPCGTIRFTNRTTSEITIDFDRETAGIACGGVIPASGPLTLLPDATADRVVSLTGTFNWSAKLTATNEPIRGLGAPVTVQDPPLHH